MASASSKIDRIWLTFLILSGLTLSAFLATNAFDASVMLSGILCVGLIAIGRREGYLFGLYSSLSYSILAYGNGLYGEVYLNLLFFVPTGVIGYLMWRRHTAKGRTVVMRQLGWNQKLLVAAFCIASTLGLGLFLSLNPLQNTPYIDATTNVLSVVATFLMMLRYKEQWLLYILLNIVTIAMWLLRVAAEGQAGDLMVVMWSLFLCNSVFGYWRWHRGATDSIAANTSLGKRQAACDGV